VRIALYAGGTTRPCNALHAGYPGAGALATSASALFEAAPFLLAGIIAGRLLRHSNAVAYLGCGCTAGPSARSLPAAAATWLLFGPLVAAARLGRRGRGRALAPPRKPVPLPGNRRICSVSLPTLLPPAILTGAATQFAAAVDPAKLPPMLSAAAARCSALRAAPCGLGAIAGGGRITRSKLQSRAAAASSAWPESSTCVRFGDRPTRQAHVASLTRSWPPACISRQAGPEDAARHPESRP